MTVADIINSMKRGEVAEGQETLEGTDSLLSVLPDSLLEAWNGKKSFPRVFGRMLAKMNGRYFINGYRFSKGKDAHKVATWIVSKIEPEVKGGL